MNFDAIVIGGGHNGLTAACYLAREGRSVLVLEKRAQAGGLAAPVEFHEGFRTQGLLTDTTLLRPRVVKDLGLENHGLAFREAPGVFVPQDDGPGLFLHPDPDKMSASNNGSFSTADAAAYREWRGFLKRISGLVRYVLDHRPPPLDDHGADGLWTALRTALKLRGLGAGDMQEVLRVAPMCAGDWLGENFKSDLLKAALVGPALEASWLGPWSAGSTATLLMRECVQDREVVGGPAALTQALLAAAKEAGVEVRTATGVRQIQISDGRAVGVIQDDGVEFEADLVVSALDPKSTFYKLLKPVDLPLSIDDQIRVLRSRGTTAKMHLALDGELKFKGRDEVFERARTGETLDDIERAFDAIKYRQFSAKPHLEIRVPSVSNKTLAPEGRHVVEILAHFAPYHLEGGWDDKKREQFGDNVVHQLERYAPGTTDKILARQVLTPADLEAEYGLDGGHIHHAEMFLDQLYAMRPSVDCAQYQTPIEGLFLCGAGTHPGGGITCQPGALAAEAILEKA